MKELAELFPAFSSFRICGRGSGSTVYSACHTRCQFPVAIKQIHRSFLTDSQKDPRFDFELSVLRTLDHPFICRSFWVEESEDSYYILTEYCPNGTLLALLNRGKQPLSELLRIFCQLVCAVHYLHKKGNFVHRDIKIENILFDEFMNVRLIDFGFSKALSECRPQLQTVCGSYPYCAPEIFQGVPYGKPVDVWSLGIVLYAMVLGKLPFQAATPTGLIDSVLKEEPVIPPDNPPMITDLLLRMLRKDPAMRVTIEEVAQHPWIRASVYAFYFEKGFLTSVPPALGRAETMAVIEKLHLDPGNLSIEGTEEWILGLIIARRKLAEVTTPAHAIGVRAMPPQVKRAMPVAELGSENRKSLLDLIGQSTGMVPRRSARGTGRMLVRPSRRQSASLLAVPKIDAGALSNAPSDP
jgi:serine/threonine protein kinase